MTRVAVNVFLSITLAIPVAVGAAHAAGKPHGGRAYVQTRGSQVQKPRGSYSKIKSRPKTKSSAKTAPDAGRARFSDFSAYSRVASPALLEPAQVRLASNGDLQLSSLPAFSTVYDGRLAGVTSQRDTVVYSLSPQLQQFTSAVVQSCTAPHVAVVAMDPKTGRILSMSAKSRSLSNTALHSGFPAASLFKIVTTAAALEKRAIVPDSHISFRGGTYTLNEWNYKPDYRKDRRIMTVTEALGRSCNPVFGRIALRFLSSQSLLSMAESFGFNAPLRFEVPIDPSTADVPEEDLGLSLTAAGFGKVTLSPIHAAALMSAVANNGLMPRPSIVERVANQSGGTVYRGQTIFLKRVASPRTARALLEMMESTTTLGTSRKEFMRRAAGLAKVRVAGKTGTLSGTNPKGVNNWFVAAAPIENPQIAVAVIVVNPGGISSKASHLGRLILERYFEDSGPV